MQPATFLDETHDSALGSWVTSAQAPGSDFPLQNLPFGRVRRAGTQEAYRLAVAIGDQALDLRAAVATGVFEALDASTREAAQALCAPTLNAFMALGQGHWRAMRLALSRVLRSGSAAQPLLQPCLLALAEVEYALPVQVGDYTDFYTSIHHATNVGKLFRPDNPLLPNYQWVPIGYHGRASSIVVSGTDVVRPHGQRMPAGAAAPLLAPCERLDYELEVGVYMGTGNPLGHPMALDQAEGHVFGLCLLNDWSARDVQAWEYQPLGPFLSKNFATTVSPWVVTMDALAPYRCAWDRPADHPQPLPYLDSTGHRERGGVDLQLEVLLQTPAMRAQGLAPERLTLGNYRHAYWSLAQMVAHHTVGGCNLQSGDLLGSGTQSGPRADEAGALIELTQGGKQPITLSNGEQRRFLQDGDTVVLRGWCERAGAARIGLGEASGTVLGARTLG
ncbi:MAG: fumarylacetoacetase [Rhodoferax sp.]